MHAIAVGSGSTSVSPFRANTVIAIGSVWQPKSGKKPLVILIGFLGCTPGIIAKYSDMYQVPSSYLLLRILPPQRCIFYYITLQLGA